MYPLVIILPLVALLKRRLATAIALIIPLVGVGVAAYHRYEELNPPKIDKCAKNGPSCVTNWLSGLSVFDYITIPTLSLTAFLLIIFFLLISLFPINSRSSNKPTKEISDESSD